MIQFVCRLSLGRENLGWSRDSALHLAGSRIWVVRDGGREVSVPERLVGHDATILPGPKRYGGHGAEEQFGASWWLKLTSERTWKRRRMGC